MRQDISRDALYALMTKVDVSLEDYKLIIAAANKYANDSFQDGLDCIKGRVALPEYEANTHLEIPTQMEKEAALYNLTNPVASFNHAHISKTKAA